MGREEKIIAYSIGETMSNVEAHRKSIPGLRSETWGNRQASDYTSGAKAHSFMAIFGTTKVVP
jgi:hypothetical protein